MLAFIALIIWCCADSATAGNQWAFWLLLLAYVYKRQDRYED